VFAGVLFIGILNDGLLLFGVAPFWFRVSSGLALVVAAALDAITRRVEAKRGGTL
jgi:ribose/xylose/arabinose/galactoside ABC-type transport system permease subunit